MKFTLNPTANYRSAGWGSQSHMQYMLTGEPFFTWNEIPLMMNDPAILFGRWVLRTPFQKIDIAKDDASGKYKIDGRPQVKEYILRTWRRFWRASLPQLIDNYFLWGRAPGGNEWAPHPGKKTLELVRVRAVEPFDATPMVFKKDLAKGGQFSGFMLKGVGYTKFVSAPHAFWFSGFEKLGPYVDAPRLKGAFPPWLQKTAPTGLYNARRLFAWTQAIGITVVRHPGEMIKEYDGTSIHSEQKAIQLGMAMQNGSVVALTSDRWPAPNGGVSDAYKWEIDQREPRTGGKDIADHVKDADSEIWFGMGIPTEVIRALDSGSGYEGRSIPNETFLGGTDETAGMIDEAFRKRTLHHGIVQNFGKGTVYDYEISSLLAEFLKTKQQGGGKPQPEGGGGAQPGQGGTGGGGGGGGEGGGGGGEKPGWRPDGTSRNGTPRETNGSRRRYVSLSGFGDAKREAAGTDKKTALLHSAASLAIIESRLRELLEGRDGDDAADEERQTIADIADDPEEITQALGAVNLSWVAYGSSLKVRRPAGVMLGWIAYGESRGGNPRWKNTETGRIRYQKSMPGSHTEKRARAKASAERGHSIVDKITRYEATPEEIQELTDHVSAMTVNDLRIARQKLAARFGSARQRTDMVRALTAHVQKKHHEVKTITDNMGGPKMRPNGTPEAPEVQDVHTVDPKQLKRRPEHMQYKVSNIGKEGITDELKGTKEYKPELGGVLLAWRDETGETGTPGEDIVVNGHHRHELAERTNAGTVNVRYINAKSAKEARAIGAIANIAEGRGTATDAAKLLRDTGMNLEDLQKAGVSLTGKIAADAAHLKDLSPAAFQRLTEGRLDERTAVAVGKHLKDEKLQDLLFKKLDKRDEDGERPWSDKEIEQAAKKMQAAGSTTVETTNLFGTFEDEESTFDQEVELESHVGRALAQAVNDFGAVANTGRASRVEGAGNVLNVEENQRRKAEAESARGTFEQLVNRSGPIAQAVKEQAAELAKAKTKREKDAVKQRTTERVREAIAAELGGGGKASADAGGKGAGDKLGTADPPIPDEPKADDAAGTGTESSVTPPADDIEKTMAETRQVGLFGDKDKPTWKAKRGAQLDMMDAAKTAWQNHAEAHAEDLGGKVEQWDAGGRFRVGDQWYQVGKAEEGFPIEPVEKASVMLGGIHAPAGGVTLKGKKFEGGEFIPSEVIDEASPEEKKALGVTEPSSHPALKPDWQHSPTAKTQNRYVNTWNGRVHYGEQPKEPADAHKIKRHEVREQRLASPRVVTGVHGGNAEIAALVFGDNPHEHVGNLTGGMQGTRVDARVSPDGTVYADLDHPDVKQWSRTIRPNPDGTLSVSNNMFFLKPNRAGGGFGTKAFAQQVREGFKQGVREISTCAGKGRYGSQQMNGFYTWARLGYDAALDSGFRAKLPPALQGAATVQDLMKTPEGRQHWKKNGYMISMKFDLTPGSPSLAALNAYLTEKGQPPIDHGPEAASARDAVIAARKPRTEGMREKGEAIRARDTAVNDAFGTWSRRLDSAGLYNDAAPSIRAALQAAPRPLTPEVVEAVHSRALDAAARRRFSGFWDNPNSHGVQQMYRQAAEAEGHDWEEVKHLARSTYWSGRPDPQTAVAVSLNLAISSLRKDKGLGPDGKPIQQPDATAGTNAGGQQ